MMTFNSITSYFSIAPKHILDPYHIPTLLGPKTNTFNQVEVDDPNWSTHNKNKNILIMTEKPSHKCHSNISTIGTVVKKSPWEIPQLHEGLFGSEKWSWQSELQIHQVHLPKNIGNQVIKLQIVRENQKQHNECRKTRLVQTWIACPVCLTTTIWNFPCIWPIVRDLSQE